jgi:hypothetical protein
LYAKSLQNREQLDRLLTQIPATKTGGANLKIILSVNTKTHVR